MLQETAQVGILLLGGQVLQIKQALIQAPLQVQGTFHSLQAIFPEVAVWLPNVLWADAAPPHPVVVLQLLQPPGMLPFLSGLLQKEENQVLQGHILVVEVEGHGQVQVDLAVDGGLTVGVVILVHL